MLMAAPWLILEQYYRLRAAYGRSVDPHVRLALRATTSFLAHLHPGFVAMNHRAAEQHLAHGMVQRRDHHASLDGPLRQRGACHVHLTTQQGIVHPIQGRAIDVLGGQSRPSVAALAILPGIGWGGIGLVMLLLASPWRLQWRQPYLKRTCCSTGTLAGMMSSCSLVSSPMRCTWPWQQAQSFSASCRSCSTRLRGRCAGKGFQPRFLPELLDSRPLSSLAAGRARPRPARLRGRGSPGRRTSRSTAQSA